MFYCLSMCQCIKMKILSSYNTHIVFHLYIMGVGRGMSGYSGLRASAVRAGGGVEA